MLELDYGMARIHEVRIDLRVGDVGVWLLRVGMLHGLECGEGQLLDFAPLHGHDRRPGRVDLLPDTGHAVVKPQWPVNAIFTTDVRLVVDHTPRGGLIT